jgi:hypothetical protein
MIISDVKLGKKKPKNQEPFDLIHSHRLPVKSFAFDRKAYVDAMNRPPIPKIVRIAPKTFLIFIPGYNNY